MKNIQKITTFMVSGALAVTLVACGTKEAPKEEVKQEEKTEKVEEKVDARQVLGEQAEGAVEVALVNSLGSKITALSVRTTGDQEYANSLIAENGGVAKDEEVRLFVAKPEKADATFDIKVKVEGSEDEIEFAEVPLLNASQVKLLQADGIAYVDYTDLKGAATSTKEAATKRKQDAEAAQSQSQVEAEATPAAQSYNESYEQSYSEPVYEEQVTYEAPAPEPVVAEPVAAEPAPAPVESYSAPEQSGDACMGDVVLRD